MPILYTTDATATGGRAGRAVSADGALDVPLSTPKELGGDGAEGTNPQQLFAAGYAACFLGALKAIALQKKVKLPETTSVTAKTGVGPRDDGQGFGLDVALTVDVPGVDPDLVEALVEQAHIACPYSHALRTPTEVAVTLA